MAPKDFALPLLAAAALATGGAVWSATSQQATQDVRITAIEARVEKLDRLEEAVGGLSTNVAVLAEQVRQLTEEVRRERN